MDISTPRVRTHNATSNNLLIHDTPMVINTATVKRSVFCFALAAKDVRRHFGKAETAQSPARLKVRFKIFDFGHVPMVINTAAVKRSVFCFALVAKENRRHFGKAETAQSPARLKARFEIFDFVYSKVIIMQTSRVTKWSGITMFLRTFEIFDFGHVPRLL